MDRPVYLVGETVNLSSGEPQLLVAVGSAKEGDRNVSYYKVYYGEDAVILLEDILVKYKK